MAEIPATMKAWVVTGNGPPKDVLVLQRDRPVPAPPTGASVMIRVSYAALNPADIQLMASVPWWLPFRREPTPGLDFAGTVVAAGPDVPAPFAPGAEVCGAVGVEQAARGVGALAEFVVVPAHLLAVRPESLGPAAAAGIMGVAGQTSALMVAAAGGAREGDRVLINGASGGVGSLLVLVLARSGAVAVGVCSGANEARVRSSGASEVVDYTAHVSLYDHLSEKYGGAPFNVIFDCVGDGVLFERSPGYLKPEGKFINIVGGSTHGVVPFIKYRLRPTFLGGTPRSYQILALRPSGHWAQKALEWVEEGIIQGVPVDSELSMEDVVQGYETLQTKRAKGKIVIKVQP